MSEAIGLLDAPIVLRLSLALVHFVWQGAVIAAIALLVLAALRRAAAAARYAALLVVLAAMAACPVVTFAVLPGPAEPMPAGSPFEAVDASALPRASGEAGPMAMAPAPPLPSPDARRPESWRTRLGGAWEWLESRLSWVAAVWMVGVVALSLRLLGGWARMMRGKRRAAVMSEARWRELVAALSRRLRVSRPVRLLESAAAGVPTVVGWLRPVILLPSSALAGLTPEQLEAVIAHELAHVRRHDYLVNLAQTVVETLLFYHPAVWWVSSRIRAEREHCCDDLAVAVCGDAVSYARALAELEQLRAPRLAVTARGGGLVGRVRRLLGSPPSEHSRLPSAVAAAFALASLLAIGVAVQVSARASETGSALLRADPVIAERAMKDTEAIADPTRADLHTVASLGEEIATSAEAEAQEEDGEVTEGPTIRRIRFEGIRELTADELLAVMETKPGRPYDPKLLARDAQKIKELYRKRGFVIAIVLARRLDDDGVLTLKIAEGEIEDIAVRGVDEQQAAAVLDAIRTKVGDVYNDEVVARELARINSLRWVESAGRDVEVGSQPGKVILVFTVTPREAVVSEGGADSEEVVYAIIDLEHVPAGYVAYLFGDARFGPAVTAAFGRESDPVEGRRGPEDGGRGSFGGGGEESGAGTLRDLLPEGIRMVTAAHYNSHQLLVGGTPEGIAELRELLTYLDRKPQGVRISATAYPGAPAECAEVRAYQVASTATRKGQDITVYSIADERRMRFLELPAGFRPQSVEVETLNLMPEVAVALLPGRPQVLLRAVPRINGDGTVTLNLWMSVLDDPEKAQAAVTPEQGDVQTTVNVGDGEACGVLLRHGDEKMTIVIKPTVVAPTG